MVLRFVVNSHGPGEKQLNVVGEDNRFICWQLDDTLLAF